MASAEDKGIDYRLVTPPHNIVGSLYHSNDPNWDTWLEICRYCQWDPLGKLKPIMYRGFVMPYNPTIRVSTKIYNEWRRRINEKRPVRIAIVGEAGLGKSYMSIHIARVLEGRYRDSKGVWTDRFSIRQIAFEAQDYLWLQHNLKAGKIICPEEPAYIFAAREWQKREQKTTVKVIETSRYMNNPLIFPVVSRQLLDKIVRDYYINYSIVMRGRGIGDVYRHWWNQLTGKMGQNRVGRILCYWPGVELARCKDKGGNPRDTCLGCEKLTRRDEKGLVSYSGDCDKFIWPQYEKKRDKILSERRAASFVDLTKEESVKSNVPQVIKDMTHALENSEGLIVNGKYHVPTIMFTYKQNRVNSHEIASFLKVRLPIPKD